MVDLGISRGKCGLCDMFCRLLGQQGKVLHATCGVSGLLKVELKLAYKACSELLQDGEGGQSSVSI